MPKNIDLEKLEKFKKAGVDPRAMGLWETKWQGGDKVLMKHKITGEERPHHYSEAEKEMIRRGDTLQPWQDKDRYAQIYQTIPGEDQREVDKFLLRRGLLKKKNG